jgi:enamine deaminase RidA (YjgF/YER057c/UK114 family)
MRKEEKVLECHGKNKTEMRGPYKAGTIYLSGQLSHDNRGNIVGLSDRQTQMRQAWADVEKCSLNTVAPCIRVLMGRAQAVGKSSYFSRRI